MSDLLPPNATTQERALSLAVDRAVPVPVRDLWSPWTCPVGILPWLAWALSVDEWDAGASEDRKRQIIAESVEQHRVKGTPYALKRALQQLGYEVEVDEKTGTAYTFGLNFKVAAGEAAGGAVLDANVARAEEIALRQKNARSELIRSRYLAEGPGIGGPLIASATVSGCETDITATTPQESGLVVLGELYDGDTPIEFPLLKETATPDFWSSDGSTTDPEFSEWYFCMKFPGPIYWAIAKNVTFPNSYQVSWQSTDDVASPDLATTWIPNGTVGTDPTGTPELHLV